MEDYFSDSSVESCRRLMDLLAGWADFAQEDDFAQNEFDNIADLYQQSSMCESDEDVRKFVKNKILPLLLSGQF